jgi:hypothetical protein
MTESRGSAAALTLFAPNLEYLLKALILFLNLKILLESADKFRLIVDISRSSDSCFINVF